MKLLITLVIVVGLGLGVWQVYQFWEKSQPAPTPAARATVTVDNGAQLSGLPPNLQPMLDAAEQRGAPGLHDFLAANGKKVSDPRLAWIQLDYVLLVAQNDPAEARRVFAQVKARLKPDSPVYSRMQQLEKTYE